MRRLFLSVSAICTALLLLALASGGGHTALAQSATSAPTAAADQAGTKVTISMGFVPSVQYAPFYVALAKGYYKAEGLDVTLNHERVQNGLQLLADGKFDFSVASGDTLSIAVSKGIPVSYVSRIFTSYPVGALAAADVGFTIKSPVDIKGHTIGISGPGSSTAIALEAMKRAAKLTDADVTVKNVGTAEVEALLKKDVEIAFIYLPNEPVTLRMKGTPIQTLTVSQYYDIVSTGLAASQKTISDKPELVQKVVSATLKGLKDTLANPDEAFDITLKQMPETTGDEVKIAREKLNVALTFMVPAKDHPLGWSDPAAWKGTVDLLTDLKLIEKAPDLAQVYTNRFAEAANVVPQIASPAAATMAATAAK